MGYVDSLTKGVKRPTTKLSLTHRLDSYQQEREKWTKAGKPTRTPERIEQLFTAYCKPCTNYSGTNCKICGCMINTTVGLNKLYWATTKCPDDPPKWLEEKEGGDSQINETPPEIPPPPPKRGCCS